MPREKRKKGEKLGKENAQSRPLEKGDEVEWGRERGKPKVRLQTMGTPDYLHGVRLNRRGTRTPRGKIPGLGTVEGKERPTTE